MLGLVIMASYSEADRAPSVTSRLSRVARNICATGLTTAAAKVARVPHEATSKDGSVKVSHHPGLRIGRQYHGLEATDVIEIHCGGWRDGVSAKVTTTTDQAVTGEISYTSCDTAPKGRDVGLIEVLAHIVTVGSILNTEQKSPVTTT